jgi:hypothetical protein
MRTRRGRRARSRAIRAEAVIASGSHPLVQEKEGFVIFTTVVFVGVFVITSLIGFTFIPMFDRRPPLAPEPLQRHVR